MYQNIPRPPRRGIFHNHNFCDFAEFAKVVSKTLWKEKKIVFKHGEYFMNSQTYGVLKDLFRIYLHL